MKTIFLLSCLLCYLSLSIQAKYKHKSEAEIVAMTPSQRVDEYANEQAYHKYKFDDDQFQLIEKYIWRDGLKALPHIIEIIDEYDPSRSAGKSGRKGERFDGAWMLLSDIDNHVIRLRSAEEGRSAITALERSIERMRRAGSIEPNQDGWDGDGRLESVIKRIEYAKGLNFRDDDINDTLRVVYQVNLRDSELLEFTHFLVARYPDYPSWSKGNPAKDSSKLSPGGYPVTVNVLIKPERFLKAYLEFKKAKL